MSKLTANLLSIGMGLLLTMASWTIHQVHKVTVDLRGVSTAVSDGKATRLDYQTRNDEDHRRILASIGTVMPRIEGEARFQQIEDQLRMLSARILRIEDKM
jgi:hypothetical protein